MNFWVKQTTRWTGEQLSSWSSVSKTVYVLFALVMYYLITDVTDVLLWWGINIAATNNERLFNVAKEHSSTVSGFIYMCGVLLFVAAVRKIALCELKDEVNGKLAIKDILIIAFSSMIISIGLNYILYYLGITSISQSYNEVNKALYSVDIFFGLIFYGICSPLAEELLFRGIIYNRMKRVFPVVFSIIVSSLLFGVFHANIVQGIYGTLMGAFIAFMYEKYKDFKVPVLIHMVANIVVYVLTYTIWK